MEQLGGVGGGTEKVIRIIKERPEMALGGRMTFDFICCDLCCS